jgi:hypothetical protein
LTHDAQGRGADGQANGDLGLAGESAGEQQVGHVGAADEHE